MCSGCSILFAIIITICRFSTNKRSWSVQTAAGRTNSSLQLINNNTGDGVGGVQPAFENKSFITWSLKCILWLLLNYVLQKCLRHTTGALQLHLPRAPHPLQCEGWSSRGCWGGEPGLPGPACKRTRTDCLGNTKGVYFEAQIKPLEGWSKREHLSACVWYGPPLLWYTIMWAWTNTGAKHSHFASLPPDGCIENRSRAAVCLLLRAAVMDGLMIIKHLLCAENKHTRC